MYSRKMKSTVEKIALSVAVMMTVASGMAADQAVNNDPAVVVADGVVATDAGTGIYKTTESETLKVWYEIPTIVADGVTVNYITVYQHDEGDPYSAFNMHFVFPVGLRVNKVRSGRDMVDDIKFSERASATHAISCNMPDATTLKIIGDSSMNDDLYSDDAEGKPLDKLFTVGMIADPSLAEGEYDVYLDGIKFVYKTGDACVPVNEPIYGKMTVNATSGIDEISADELDANDCFDLMGQKVDPKKAHNMIVVTKGRKVYVR